MNLSGELETAIGLARTAGRRIMEFYGSVVAEEKLGVDNFSEPVTVADRAASRLIVDGLSAAFPEDGILSEEETDVVELRTSRNRVWMIDPIDGTQGFINKDGDFGVQIGLTEDGEAILGVVFLPFHDELLYAVRGEGAFFRQGNDEIERLTVSGKTDFTEMRLAVSRNHLSPKMSKVSAGFGIGNVVQRGSVGLKVGLIARREADLYIHLSPRTKFWDSCGPQVIIEEAGGKMTDLFGTPIRYDLHDVQNHNGIVASNGIAHERIIDKLGVMLNDFGRRRK